jgi:hypothetical protein
MKFITLAALIAMTACATAPTHEQELAAHLEAEADFHAHQAYLERLYTEGFDPEYIDDCIYYEMGCGF